MVRDFTPALLTTGITFSLALVFLVYGALNFYRDPLSIFYDSEHAYDRSYSQYREIEVKAWREAFFRSGSQDIMTDPFETANHTAIMCAAMMTVARGKENSSHPLEIALSSVLAGMSPVERQDLDLRVYFANTDPKQHSLWNSTFLRLADRIVHAGVLASETQMQELIKLEAAKDFRRKTSLDFAFAVENCYNSGSPYIALFEGDIVIADGWFARARQALLEIESRHDQAWLDMRLFNDDQNIGWATRQIFANNELWISLGFAFVVIIATTLIRLLTRLPTPPNQALAVICCLTMPLAVVLFFQAGKASMLPPGDGVVRQDWGCCTQGQILQRGRVPGLVEYLRRRAGEQAADILFVEYAKEGSLARYALNPVQIQHLGFQSVLSPERKANKMIWSVAFEDLVPEILREDHERGIAELYLNEF